MKKIAVLWPKNNTNADVYYEKSLTCVNRSAMSLQLQLQLQLTYNMHLRTIDNSNCNYIQIFHMKANMKHELDLLSACCRRNIVIHSFASHIPMRCSKKTKKKLQISLFVFALLSRMEQRAKMLR